MGLYKLEDVSANVLSTLTRYLNHVKIDAVPLLNSVGIDPQILEQPDCRISGEKYFQLEKEAILQSGDPDFGLHLGEFTESGSFSILSYMMMSCRTLEEAEKKVRSYERIVGTIVRTNVVLGFGKTKIIYEVPENAHTIERHYIEGVFSTVFTFIRKLTGRTINRDIRVPKGLFCISRKICFVESALPVKDQGQIKYPTIARIISIIIKRDV